MTKKEIAILAFKCLSIYAFIHAADKLRDILYFMSGNTAFDELSMTNILNIGATPLLITVFGIFLWYGAPLLAYSIFGSSVSGNGTGASVADVQVTAFSIIGLLIIASALTDITKSLIMEFSVASAYGTGKEFLFVRNVYFGLFLIKIAFGSWLVFGSRGIVNFIRSMRRD